MKREKYCIHQNYSVKINPYFECTADVLSAPFKIWSNIVLKTVCICI